MSKKFCKLIIVVFFMFMFFIGTIDAEECVIHVGEDILDSDNTQLSDGKGGTITWDNDTSTLTLNNFNYEGPGVYLYEDTLNTALGILNYWEDDVNIVINGINTFKLNDEDISDEDAEGVSSYVWYFESNIAISGDGELNLYNNDKKNYDVSYGLYTDNYSIKDVTLNIYGKNAITAVYGIESNVESKIEGANVNIVIPNNFIDESDLSNIGISLNGNNDTLSIIDSNITMDIGNAYALHGFDTKGSISVENNSFLDIKMSKENKNNSFVFYAVKGFSAENSIILAKSGLCVFAIGNGNVSFSNTIAELSGGEGLFSDEYGITFTNYANKTLFISANSDGSDSIAKQESPSNLYDYKYLKIKVGTPGERKLGISNPGLSVSRELIDLVTFTNKEKALIENGNDVTVTVIFDNNVSDEDKQLINNKIKDNVIAKFYNISLTKKIKGEETEIPTLNGKTLLKIQLDTSLINKDETKIRTYSMARVHDGNVEIIDSTFNKVSYTIEFETDKFSTYALLYKDEDINKEPEEKIPEGNKELNPKTGDNAYVYFIGGILSFVLVVGLLSILKKSN